MVNNYPHGQNMFKQNVYNILLCTIRSYYIVFIIKVRRDRECVYNANDEQWIIGMSAAYTGDECTHDNIIRLYR